MERPAIAAERPDCLPPERSIWRSAAWPITTAANDPSHHIHRTAATTEATASPFTRRAGRTKVGATGAGAGAETGVTSYVSRSSCEHQRAPYASVSRSSSSSESSRPSSAATRRRSAVRSRSASEARRSCVGGSYGTAGPRVVTRRCRVTRIVRSTSRRLVLERDREADAEGADPTVLDRHVLAHDLGDAQVADRLRRRLDRVPRGRLPRFAADSDHLGDAVDAVGHRSPPGCRCGGTLSRNDRGPPDGGPRCGRTAAADAQLRIT